MKVKFGVQIIHKYTYILHIRFVSVLDFPNLVMIQKFYCAETQS